MKKSIDLEPGLTLTARVWDDDTIANNSTLAFETPDPLNVTDYDNSAPEAGGAGNSGRYVVTIPAWLPQNVYSLTFYDASGLSMGTVTLDTRDVSALSVTPSTGLSALVLNLRTLANDTVTANFVPEEGSKPAPNTVALNFRLQNRNVVAGSVYASFGTTFRTQTGFTLDGPNGIVTFAAAPAAGSGLQFEYNFQWFTDDDYIEFLLEGARAMTLTDPATVVAGLVPAMLQFGLSYFYTRRATQYAHKYASSGGQAGQQVDTVTGSFRALAKAAWEKATQLRDDYYQNQGRRNAPASAAIAYGFDPFTPQR